MYNITSLYLAAKSLSTKEMYLMTKAKQSYVKLYPECAICGCQSNLEVHHCRPVHLFPSVSADLSNFITLHDSSNNSCHKWFGHFGNFSSKWNPYIREYAVMNRIFIQKNDPKRVFIISTEQLISDFSKAIGISDIEFTNRVNSLLNYNITF